MFRGTWEPVVDIQVVEAVGSSGVVLLAFVTDPHQFPVNESWREVGGVRLALEVTEIR